MKIKNNVQRAVLAVIGFILAQAIAMVVAMAGTLSLYVGGGVSAIVVAPCFAIMAKRIQKKGAAFLFWLIYGVLYALMGAWIMIPITIISGIFSEIIEGDYSSNKRISYSFAVGMFLVALHPIIFFVILGPDLIAKFMSYFTLEELRASAAMYTGKVIGSCVVINIVLSIASSKFGNYISNKFFNKNKGKGKLV